LRQESKKRENMSTYAILGATGNVGLSILKLLGASPANRIHVLVRSRSKLQRLYPALDSNTNIKVFEGNISEMDVLARCLSGTHAVFLTVAITENQPGTTIAEDTARNVISALSTLKARNTTFRPPHLIILSSSSTDDKFWPDHNLAHTLIYTAFSNVYNDLKRARTYLRSPDVSDWVSSTFVMPGALTNDVQLGHKLSIEKQPPPGTFLSFLDLAAAMIEVADQGSERWDGTNVSVLVKGERQAKAEWSSSLHIARGWLYHFFPWLWGKLPW
jgi:hypothetical protein